MFIGFETNCLIAEEQNLNAYHIDIITARAAYQDDFFSDTQAFPIKGDLFLFCLATELFVFKSKIISLCKMNTVCISTVKKTHKAFQDGQNVGSKLTNQKNFYSFP